MKFACHPGHLGLVSSLVTEEQLKPLQYVRYCTGRSKYCGSGNAIPTCASRTGARQTQQWNFLELELIHPKPEKGGGAKAFACQVAVYQQNKQQSHRPTHFLAQSFPSSTQTKSCLRLAAFAYLAMALHRPYANVPRAQPSSAATCQHKLCWPPRKILA